MLNFGENKHRNQEKVELRKFKEDINCKILQLEPMICRNRERDSEKERQKERDARRKVKVRKKDEMKERMLLYLFSHLFTLLHLSLQVFNC